MGFVFVFLFFVFSPTRRKYMEQWKYLFLQNYIFMFIRKKILGQ